MTEKRVSVRLVAVGGRQVRAELEGIGEAGTKGFGRLSAEMERANTRLAGFARKAGVALAAMTVAAAAAGVAMVRSSLEAIDAQAKLAQSFGTTVESVQALAWAGELAGVSMGEIETATRKLTGRLSDAAAGSGAAVKALARLNLSATELQSLPLDQRLIAIQEALARYVPQAERAAVASDLFGDKAALAFLRIDPATLKEAAKDVRDFGVAVNAADAVQIERTGDALARLGLIGQGFANRLTVAVAPALEGLANWLAEVARGTGPLGQAMTGLLDNLARVASYAVTFASVLATRWVAGLAAAALSVKGLAFGLVALRAALIRTGIGALIVSAGELVFQFTRLAGRVGGVGAAFQLLGEVAWEAWDRIGLSAGAAWARVEAGWAGTQAVIYDGLQLATDAVFGWANATVGAFQGAFDAVKSIWGMLPQAIGDFAYQAANGLISGVEAMLNAVVGRINRFIEGLNAALDLLPDWATGAGGVAIGTLKPVDLAGIANPYAGAAAAAGTAAADAFRNAMNKTYVDAPDHFGSMAGAARDRAAGYTEAAGMLADAASRPMTAWQKLKAAIFGTGTETETALAGASGAAGDLTNALTETEGQAGRTGAAGKTAGDAVAAAAEAAKADWTRVSEALATYATEALDVAGQMGEGIVRAFKGAEDAVVGFVTTGKFDFNSLADSILADITRIALRSAILGPIANALSGAFAGGGGIFAGIFHQGGMVGQGAPARLVPAAAFAGAQRFHGGGMPGLRPDEVPAILQRGERVLSRREVAAGNGEVVGAQRPVQVVMNITTPDVNSFRQAQGQVAADARRALERARRNL